MKKKNRFVNLAFKCSILAFAAVSAMLVLAPADQALADPDQPGPHGDPASGWITDQVVNVYPNIDDNPVLATGPNGTLHAAWQHNSDGTGDWDICYANSADGGATWGPCNLVAYLNVETNPDIAVSPLDGKIFIAFEMEQVAGNREIFVAYSDDGDAWATVPVSANVTDELNPSIVIEHDRDPYWVHVAFESDVPGNGRDLHEYVSADGGLTWVEQLHYGFTDTRVISDPKLEYQRGTDTIPRIYMLHFVDYQGVQILWSEDDGWTWFGPGTLWWGPELKGEPTIAASRDGDTLMAAWHEEVPGDYLVRYFVDDDPTTPGSGWAGSLIDTPGLNDRAPRLAVDGEGTTNTTIGGKFHLVWTVATIRLNYTSLNTDLSGGLTTFEMPSDSTASPSPGSPKGLTTQNRGGTWYPAISWLDGRTADWDIYYTTSGSRVTVDTNVSGLYLYVDGMNVSAPYTFDWPAGLNHTLYAPSPQYLDATTRCIWSDWSDSGAQTHDVTATKTDTLYMSGFLFQYKIEFLASPPVGGLEMEADGVPDFFPTSYWWFLGSTHEIFAPSPQLQTGASRFVFDHWSDFGPPRHSITVSGSDQYVCYFTREYNVTIDTGPSGLDVEVDFVTCTSPQSFWWNEGSTHTLYAPSPQITPPMDTRYVFYNWSDNESQGHDITVVGSETITAFYMTQYLVGLDTDPTSLEVVIDGVPQPTPVSFWWADGSSHSVNATSPQSAGPGSRYIFNYWSDFGPQEHSIIVTAPSDLTAFFTMQYYLTVSSAYGNTFGEGWYNEMDTAFAGLDTGVYVITPNAERYMFAQWGGDASGADYSQSLPIVMDSPKTALAMWNVQWYLTVNSSYGTTSGEGWYDDMATAWAGLDTAMYVITPNAERFVFTQWGGDASGVDYLQSDPILMNAPKLASALWTQQYYLTVDSTYGTTSGEGWYQGGAIGIAGLDIGIFVVTPNAERWVFSYWAGDASGPDFAQSDPIVMDQPKTADAIWQHQYYLDVQSPHGTPTGDGWYDEFISPVAGLDIDVYVVAPSAERFVFLQWGGDATGTGYASSDPIMMDGPKTAVAEWGHQYYLSVDSPFVPGTGSGWYDENVTAFAGLDSDEYVITPNGERYVFEGWDGDAAGTNYAASDPILMDGPKTASAMWTHQFWLVISAESGGSPLIGVTVSIDGSASGATPHSDWFNDAATYSVEVEDPVSISGADYEFLYWAHGPIDNPLSYVISGATTIVAEYQEVSAAPHFGVDISPVSRQIAAGDMTTYYVNISSYYGFTGTVSLDLTGLPAPAQWMFNPSSVTLIADATEMSILTIGNTGSLAQTTHTLMVTGNDGTATDTADASLIVSGVAAAGSIAGTVVDQNLSPLAGAVVDLMSGQTVLSTQTTGSSGEFNFTAVSAGSYTIRATLSGYATDSENVTLGSGGWETVTLQLEEVTGSITGRVRDGETLEFIEGAAIQVYDLDGNLLGSVTSTPTGVFSIEGLPLVTCDVKASKEGYRSKTIVDQHLTAEANEMDLGIIDLVPEGAPAEVGLADYWWVIVIVIVVLLLVLLLKRRRPVEEVVGAAEEVEEPAEELEEEFDERSLEELFDDESLLPDME